MRRSSLPWFILLALPLLIPTLGAAPEAREMPENWFFQGRPEAYTSMVGKAAPKLSLDGFINGESFTNSDLKGKITVVDIWATWCGPCIRAIPKNNQLAEKYADQGVQVIGVTTSQGQEKLPEMVKQHNIKYLVATDPTLATGKAWNVAFYPTYAIVDREGIVRGIGLSPNHVEDAIKMILKEQPKADEVADAGNAQ